MAEINKLSVGKVLDKLRRNDAPKKSKTMQLDEKAEKMDEEIQRLRAATRRLKSGPRAGTTGRRLRPIGAAEVAVDVERAVKLDNLTHGEFPSACQTGSRTPRPVGRPWLQLSRDLRKVPAAAFHARPATGR